ncbi:MAG: PhzF family phenazine biosynthesis protein [Betaproteobacteria bacterium]|nr:PhzF family phenazine biosynthesis protein [Betaproteobacteria bacterium]
MKNYTFRILNVFAETALGGNPLAVFEDARDMDEATMQALALQFNLSETTFILPSTLATARVRIFTPTFEMPFAGHPTLGTAQVVRNLTSCGDDLTLEMRAGIIPVTAAGDVWTLTAAPPKTRAPQATRADLAQALGLSVEDIGATPLWVNTGNEQLVIPLTSVDAVRRCQPDAALMQRHCCNGQRTPAYVWAHSGENQTAVRYFYGQHGSVCEDPGTGSACANLGGYLLATGQHGPLAWTLHQGAQVGRPCTLKLTLGADDAIHVGGRVIEIGRGEIVLP